MAGQLGQPLGRPAGGGAEGHPVGLVLVQGEDGVDRGGLAGAGAAGQHHHVAGEGHLDGLALQRRVGKALRPLEGVDLAGEPPRHGGGLAGQPH